MVTTLRLYAVLLSGAGEPFGLNIQFPALAGKSAQDLRCAAGLLKTIAIPAACVQAKSRKNSALPSRQTRAALRPQFGIFPIIGAFLNDGGRVALAQYVNLYTGSYCREFRGDHRQSNGFFEPPAIIS